MNRHQVAHYKCAVQLIFGYFEFLRILDDRQGARHALIAASGINDNRHGAAIHPGIRSGCRFCLCTNLNIITICIQKRTAYFCAVRIAQPFF